MNNQNYANPDPGLVRRLRELGTPEAEIPARAAAIMREVDAALDALHTCEYTANGADPTPDAPACGQPATVKNPRLDADYDEWYCDEHADPAWKAARP